jgi:hypothetical protein
LDKLNRILVRNQKIGLAAKAMKWYTRIFWGKDAARTLEMAMDAGEAYLHIKQVDSFSYETIFIATGIILAYLINKLFFSRKSNNNKNHE